MQYSSSRKEEIRCNEDEVSKELVWSNAYGLSACSIPPPSICNSLHILLYLILPSYNSPSSPLRILNFIHMYFLHKFFTLFSLHMTKSHQSISFHPFHCITLHSICTNCHATSFIHAFIVLILPSCHATCFSQVTNFHRAHSWLVCLILKLDLLFPSSIPQMYGYIHTEPCIVYNS